MSRNSNNVRAFQKDLHSVAAELNVDVSKVVIKVALDLQTKFSRRNPVDTGRSRAGWDVKEGQPSSYIPPEGSYAGTIPTDSSGLTGRTIVFVTNAVDYVEYLDRGSSQQAPAGIIDISIAEEMIEIDSYVATLRNR